MTALTLASGTYALDAQSYLGELQVFGIDLNATEVETHGLADGHAFTQVTKRAAVHRFELMKDNSGPKLTNLHVATWTPDGSALIGDLESGNVRLTIPVADGSGIKDPFEYPNFVGARRIEISADMKILANATSVPILTDARSTTEADWNMANVLLSFGTGMVFDLPMVLTNAGHSFERDGLQMVKANYKLRGTPATVPTATTLYDVAFGGDGIIGLSSNVGFDTWTGTGLVTSLDISFANRQVVKVTGELAIQGQPGLS